MAGGVRITSDPAGDMGETSGARVDELVRLMRRTREPPTTTTSPSLWQRLTTPATWEMRVASTLTDLLRRASTPAPWEQRASEAVARLLRGGG